MKIGAQLYTLRSFCKNLDDFSETLKKVADIGYTTVQVSGTCAYEADWLAEQLKSAGLTCELTHFDIGRITKDTDKVVEEHNRFGCKHIGIGCMPLPWREEGVDGTLKFVDSIKDAAKRVAELGSVLMYHNHGFEYENKTEDGKSCMELMSELIPASDMGFTLDTYWVKYGGYEPVEEIKRLSGRIPRMHFKDMEVLEDGTRRYTWVGNGILKFEPIIAALESAGTEVAFVEQDDCFGEDPFVCLTKSYNYLKSLGLR